MKKKRERRSNDGIKCHVLQCLQTERIQKQQAELARAFEEEQRKLAEKEERVRLENLKKAQEAEVWPSLLGCD